MPSKTDIIEALLFASDRPVPLKKLAGIVEISEADALEELAALREEKTHIGALQVLEVAGGWQVVTKPEFARHITKLRDEKRQKLSRAAFEVLAIVAYRQPATRADIESLRGVDCAGSLQFLLEKKLLAFAGRKEAPGRPWLYATTPQFLDHFGLRSVEDMPSLAELAELNDDAAQAQTRDLFSRGAMTAQEESQPDSGARVLARETQTADDDANAMQIENAAMHAANSTATSRVLAHDEAHNHDANESAEDNALPPETENASRVPARERQEDAPRIVSDKAGNNGENKIAPNVARADTQNSDPEKLALSSQNDSSKDAARKEKGGAS